MDAESLQGDVSRLIEAFPDVEVRTAEIIGDFSVIEFFTPSIDSLARLSYAAMAVNANVDVEPPYSFSYTRCGYGGEMDSSDLKFRLRIEHVGEGSPPLSTLDAFGITIARDLVALGLISREKYDFLMESWDVEP